MPVECWRVICRGTTEALLCSVDIEDGLASIRYKKVQHPPTSPTTVGNGGQSTTPPKRVGQHEQLTLPLAAISQKATESPQNSSGACSTRSLERVNLQELVWHEDSANSLKDVLHIDVSHWTLDKFFKTFPTRKIRIPLPAELVMFWNERENEYFAWIKKYCTDPHYLSYYTEIVSDELCMVVNRATSSETEEFMKDAISKLQQEILKTIERKQRRWKLLEERGGAAGGENAGETAEVLAHESVVGIVMGKQGENLSRVARAHKVEIRVYPDEDGIRRIRIYGQSLRQVQEASQELDYVYRSYQLPSNSLGDLIEQIITDAKSAQGKELAQINGIHSVWLKRDHNNCAPPQLFICGLTLAITHYINTLKKQYEHRNKPPASTVSPCSTAASGAASRSQKRGHRSHGGATAWQLRAERGAYEAAV